MSKVLKWIALLAVAIGIIMAAYGAFIYFLVRVVKWAWQ